MCLQVPDFVVFLDDVDDKPLHARLGLPAPRQPPHCTAGAAISVASAPQAPMPSAFPSMPRISHPPAAVYSPLHDDEQHGADQQSV